MPKLKPSQGRLTFSTPFPEEFQRWLCYELANARHWNKDQISGGMSGMNQWHFHLGNQWTISYDGKIVTVESKLSRFAIRQGLTIDMANGRILIGASIS